MANLWYVKSKRGVIGPLDSREIRRLALTHELRPNDMMSLDGETWMVAQSVRGIQFPMDSQTWYIRTLQRTDRDESPDDRWASSHSDPGAGRVGPFPTDSLIQFARTGRINSRTAISSDGTQWISARCHPDLKFHHVDEQRWFVRRFVDKADDVVGSAEEGFYSDGPYSLRTLAVKARTGTLSAFDRVSIDGENWMWAKRVLGLRFSRVMHDDRPQDHDLVDLELLGVDSPIPESWKLPIVTSIDQESTEDTASWKLDGASCECRSGQVMTR